MTVFVDTIYPVVLAACLALALFGTVCLFVQRAHGALRYAVMGFVIIIGVEVLAVVYAIVSGDAAPFITIAYVVAAVALLGLLGIARLGTPEAAAKDPGRPVLQPDQIARVDGAAAILVAGAQAVVAWRFYEIMMAAA
jgi:hypothetical protein